MLGPVHSAPHLWEAGPAAGGRQKQLCTGHCHRLRAHGACGLCLVARGSLRIPQQLSLVPLSLLLGPACSFTEVRASVGPHSRPTPPAGVQPRARRRRPCGRRGNPGAADAAGRPGPRAGRQAAAGALPGRASGVPGRHLWQPVPGKGGTRVGCGRVATYAGPGGGRCVNEPSSLGRRMHMVDQDHGHAAQAPARQQRAQDWRQDRGQDDSGAGQGVRGEARDPGPFSHGQGGGQKEGGAHGAAGGRAAPWVRRGGCNMYKEDGTGGSGGNQGRMIGEVWHCHRHGKCLRRQASRAG
jgi:hypothetical protein